MEAKKDQEFQLGYSRPYSDPEGYLTVGRDAPMQPSPEKTWKWSGTDFIKSPTEEPWVSIFTNCVQFKCVSVFLDCTQRVILFAVLITFFP